MANKPAPMLLTLGDTPYPQHDRFASLYGRFGYHSVMASSGLPAGVPGMDADKEVKFGHMGDGTHKVTRLGAMFPAGHCRFESTGVLWRNWHGGPMLYQRVAD